MVRLERHVRGQHLRHHPLRLEGEHPAPLADQAGEGERVRPDVGADVDDVVTRLAQLAEQRRLPRAPLAVVLDAAADVAVVDVVEHVAVPRLDQVVEAGAADELPHPRGFCESTDCLTQISSKPNTATCL